MARFEITSPSGQRFEITAPDGASDADVMAYAQKQFANLDTGRQAASGAPKPRAWSDVPGEALSNASTSAGNFVSNLTNAVMHPLQTAQSVADLGAGAIREGAKRILPESVISAIDSTGTPETTQRIESTAQGVGQHLKDRYGSMEGLKNTLATDPVGAAADASMLLTGGGGLVARAPGVVGQAGQVAARAGSLVDPIQATGRAAAMAGRGGAEVLGLTTGTGARPIQEAFRAGQEANPTLLEHMRGQAPITEAVDIAERGVNAMGDARRQAYNAGIQATRQSPAIVDTNPVRAALDSTRDVFQETTNSGATILKNPVAANTYAEIGGIIDTFENLPRTDRTPIAFDAVKQRIGAIRDNTRQGTRERAVADRVYQAINAEIERQVPDYANAMRGYARASDQIGEMRRTLSINDRASTDTTLRKLQSTMRNNVNTNWGARTRLLDELAQHEPNLPAALAGQSLNALAPRGLARIPAGVGAVGAAQSLATNPLALALLPATSPRLVGEAAYAAGRGAGMVQRGAQAAHIDPRVLAQALLITSAMGRGQQP